MSNDKYLPEDDQEDKDGSSGEAGGTGRQSGEIEFRFHDALLGPTRDDLLSPSELKRLQIIHPDIHLERVKKQKQTREERKALKEGRMVTPTAAQQLKQGLGGSGSSRLKSHPISQKAQFSGIDKQVIGIPTLNDSNTNDKQREALENRLENKYRLTNQKRFDPRPRMN